MGETVQQASYASLLLEGAREALRAKGYDSPDEGQRRLREACPRFRAQLELVRECNRELLHSNVIGPLHELSRAFAAAIARGDPRAALIREDIRRFLARCGNASR